MAKPNTNLRLDVIETLDGFVALKSAWSRLVDDSNAGPFATFEWITCWGKVFWDNDTQAQIMTVWDGDRLVAALPLRLKNKRVTHRLPLQVSTLQMLYDDRVGYHDVMMVSGYEAAMGLIFEACRARAAYMDLTPLQPSPGLEALQDYARAKGRWVFLRDEITTGISDMSEGWDAYLSRRSSKTRKRIRSLERKLKAVGVVHVARQADDDGLRILEKSFDVSRRSWKAQMGSDIGTKDTDRAFFTHLFEALAPTGEMRLTVLELDGVAVSSAVTLCRGQTAYGLVLDYDDAYSDQAVGRFVGDEEMRIAVQEGATYFDMLRATHFTSSFCDEFAEYQRLRIALRPSLARWIVQGEALVRSIAKSLRGGGPKVTGRRKFFQTSAGSDK